MHSYLMSAFLAVLFILLTPGVLLTIPPKGSKVVVAVVHGIIFALIYHFTHKAVWRMTRKYEGFANKPVPITSKLNQGFENPPKELKEIASSLGFKLTSK